MIPSTNSQLLVAEDWTKIYQSFRNADFQSYDFETLRRTMINYLRQTYPEDFNDYIDSSEYIALVDLIAYLGQNLSFRIDLNSRENFLETAQRRESILRLAQLVSYNPKRNVPAHGMLKILAVSTTESVLDANGTNLANQVIVWNDSANTNWYQQFISIMNSSMEGSMIFGRPDNKDVILGVTTEQYSINSTNSDLPIYSVTKSVNGSPMTFEITGAVFKDSSYIYEPPPVPGSAFNFVFQNDNQGAGSANTGFFVHFRQGTMGSTPFNITSPVPNEVIGVNASGINDTDVWLWQLGVTGGYDTLWTKVNSLTGNNVIYNSLSKSTRTLYSVASRANDQIDLNFTDGSFGELPRGSFRLFYRQSNSQRYSISPDQMSGISIIIPYQNKAGIDHRLTLTLGLQYTVDNSRGTESSADIKLKAPQAYYLQNRMITAEDYNIGPLTAGSGVLKVSSVNRISSGISKYFELSDISGKYSSTDIFAKDGILYKEEKTPSFEFKFQSRNQLFSAIKKQLEPIIVSKSFKNFYFENYPRPSLQTLNLEWVRSTKKSDQTTGYFQTINNQLPVLVGNFSITSLQYIGQGTLIKFQAPVINGRQTYFAKNGQLTEILDPTTTLYKWSKVIQVIGDGANSGKGNLDDGTGPIITSGKIPSEAVPVELIPAFVTAFSYAFETQIVNLCLVRQNFGLGFDKISRSWYIITNSNLDFISDFSLLYQGDLTNLQKDSSWLVLFQWTGLAYKVTYRLTEYIFESANQTAFFVDYSNFNYDYTTDTILKDQIDVLSVNNSPTSGMSLSADYRWQIESAVVEPDGYVEPKKVVVSFYDANNDGQIDSPDAFEDIVSPKTTDNRGYYNKFVYFKISADDNRYSLVVDQSSIQSLPNEGSVNFVPENGQLFYFYDPDIDVIKYYDAATQTFILTNQYFAKLGRSGLKFHYIHNTGDERRIDPSKSNIIDVYVLTASYDLAFRKYLQIGAGSEPLPPTSQSLENDFSEKLENIKSVSDTLIFQSARYKVLFGSLAPSNLQCTFKAVRNSTRIASDNDLKSKILSAINEFFNLDNWDFGQSFNFTELSTYVLNQVSPDIVNFVIVPKDPTIAFGSLFEIACQSHEILVSGATVDDIEIIDALTSAQINAASTIFTSTSKGV